MRKKQIRTKKTAKGLPFTPERRSEFLGYLAEAPNIARASRKTGINSSTAYYWRERDTEFGARMNAILCGVSVLEARRMQRKGGSAPALIRRGHNSPNDADIDAFLETLAETSNVCEAARRAGMITATLYRLRRKDPGFARRWLAALDEGYEELEMEMLARARFGVSRKPDDPAFNEAVSLRLLMAHKDAVALQRAIRSGIGAEELRERLERKIALVRESLETQPAPDGDA
ncbi:MAG: hypothetical protein AAGE05_10700 [Pseudomonadota bacterium]